MKVGVLLLINNLKLSPYLEGCCTLITHVTDNVHRPRLSTATGPTVTVTARWARTMTPYSQINGSLCRYCMKSLSLQIAEPCLIVSFWPPPRLPVVAPSFPLASCWSSSTFKFFIWCDPLLLSTYIWSFPTMLPAKACESQEMRIARFRADRMMMTIRYLHHPQCCSHSERYRSSSSFLEQHPGDGWWY